MKLNTKKIAVLSLLAVMIGVGGAFTKQAEALSLTAFVDLLIERGIIAGDKEEQAKRAARALAGDGEQALNADKVEVVVSQLIQHSDRTYEVGEEVVGLHLRVKNTSDETIALEGRARCALSYKIYAGSDELVYDSAEHAPCTSGETMTFYLQPGQMRLLEMKHTSEEYALMPGSYTVFLEYPGYGSGEKEIEVVEVIE